MYGLTGLVLSEKQFDELNDEDKKRHRLGSNNFSTPRSNKVVTVSVRTGEPNSLGPLNLFSLTPLWALDVLHHRGLARQRR